MKQLPTNLKLTPIVTDLMTLKLLQELNGVIIMHGQQKMLAVHDSSKIGLKQQLEFYLKERVSMVKASTQQIELALKMLTQQQNRSQLSEIAKRLTQENAPTHVSRDEPIIQFIDELIDEAIKQQASDIHIEPQKNQLIIRFRIDGLLRTIETTSIALAKRVSTRLKIMSHLDIAKLQPQDGRTVIQSNSQVFDLRVNCYPTLHGEKIVLRLLNHQQKPRDLCELGFTEKQLDLFKQKIKQPQGLIIVTGPTGSGKTNTMYAALAAIQTETKNCVTIEDPIEIQLTGINQSAIKPEINLTFASMLRAILRQDPDIIMIGEIRDFETADIAIKAAQTGHLVLTTLHTKSAKHAILRLQNMGINQNDLLSAVTLITNQRLARKLCQQCHGMGCAECHEGYQGRFAIHELVAINEKMQLLENETLTDSARRAIQNKLTNEREIKRVLLLNESEHD